MTQWGSGLQGATATRRKKRLGLAREPKSPPELTPGTKTGKGASKTAPWGFSLTRDQAIRGPDRTWPIRVSVRWISRVAQPDPPL